MEGEDLCARREGAAAAAEVEVGADKRGVLWRARTHNKTLGYYYGGDGTGRCRERAAERERGVGVN